MIDMNLFELVKNVVMPLCIRIILIHCDFTRLAISYATYQPSLVSSL